MSTTFTFAPMLSKKKGKSNDCQMGESGFFEKRNESMMFQFHQIHNAMFRIANQKITNSSVPVKMEQLPVFMTLFWLKEQSQQEIADHVHRDKSSVLRTVTALEKKGLVMNKKDHSDGRRKVLMLTETGKFVAGQIINLITEIETEIAGALTDRPKPEFLEILKKASQKLDLLANS